MTPDETQDLAELLGIAELVRAERVDRRVSQAELAKRSGVAQSTVSRVESGEVVPSLSTVVTLLAALDLQPSISPVDRWSDVDAAAQRLAALSLEEVCGDLEPWLQDIGDATAEDAANRTAVGLLGSVAGPVPMAICGASAAQLLRLPVRPRRIELMSGAGVEDVRRVMRWATTQLMRPRDPRTLQQLTNTPEVDQMLEWGCLAAQWGGMHCRVAFDPGFASMPITRVRVFDVDVPVLALEALRSAHPWVRRVLQRTVDAA